MPKCKWIWIFSLVDSTSNGKREAKSIQCRVPRQRCRKTRQSWRRQELKSPFENPTEKSIESSQYFLTRKFDISSSSGARRPGCVRIFVQIVEIYEWEAPLSSGTVRVRRQRNWGNCERQKTTMSIHFDCRGHPEESTASNVGEIRANDGEWRGFSDEKINENDTHSRRRRFVVNSPNNLLCSFKFSEIKMRRTK